MPISTNIIVFRCQNEKDDSSPALCQEWARVSQIETHQLDDSSLQGGLCEAHRATAYLFCRYVSSESNSSRDLDSNHHVIILQTHMSLHRPRPASQRGVANASLGHRLDDLEAGADLRIATLHRLQCHRDAHRVLASVARARSPPFVHSPISQFVHQTLNLRLLTADRSTARRSSLSFLPASPE